MKRKVKFVEPETMTTFAYSNLNGKLSLNETGDICAAVMCRIIRERDYQKLLKLAMGKK